MKTASLAVAIRGGTIVLLMAMLSGCLFGGRGKGTIVSHHYVPDEGKGWDISVDPNQLMPPLIYPQENTGKAAYEISFISNEEANLIASAVIYGLVAAFGGGVPYELHSLASKQDQVIRYTLDGTEPTETSPVFTDKFILTVGKGEKKTVKAKAYKDGFLTSQVATRTYSFVESTSKDETEIMLPGDVPLVLVRIPAGDASIGYPHQSSMESLLNPQKEITISQDYYMGKYEVTQTQWLAVMGTWAGEGPEEKYGIGGDYPVYNVSQRDAHDFIAALNTHLIDTGQEHITVKLPSSAEWEYACRATTKTAFYWGNDVQRIDQYAWHRGNSNGTVHSVGGKLPNAYGLYDMIGNVEEWCDDTHYVGGCIIRGGNFNTRPAECGSANLLALAPTAQYANLGFRLAVDAVIESGDSELIEEQPILLFLEAEHDVTVPQPEIVEEEIEDIETSVAYAETNVEPIDISHLIRLGEEQLLMLPGNVPLVMVRIPAGTFMMGRYPDEQDSYSNEDPQHPVDISQDFYMSKYEITQKQWLAIMTSWPGDAPDEKFGQGDDYPAYFVNWDDAKKFIEVLNKHLRKTNQWPASVRLPSEAEWEYACRAGSTTRYYFGDSLDCNHQCEDCAAGAWPGNRSDYMWYCGNNAPQGTQPVGLKLPNAFGLYDMAGNVTEWCEDDYHHNYNGAPTNGSAWKGGQDARGRVLRGGGWHCSARPCRSAFRHDKSRFLRHSGVGFRVVR